MKHLLRLLAVVLLVTGVRHEAVAQACAKLPALTTTFDNGNLQGWTQRIINCSSAWTYPNQPGCDYYAPGQNWMWGYGVCQWCVLGPGNNGSAYCAVLDMACNGAQGGHLEGDLISPTINMATICDPNLPAPNLNFFYAYIPSAIQPQFGTVEMSVEVTANANAANPTWYVAQLYADMGAMATGLPVSGFWNEEYTPQCYATLFGQRAINPTAAQWKPLSVRLPDVVKSSSNVAVRFRIFTEGAQYSGWFPIFLDDISIDGPYNKDVAVSALGSLADSAVIAPTTTFTPTMRVRQVGSITLGANATSVTYQIYPLNSPAQTLYTSTKSSPGGYNPPAAQCQDTGVTFPPTSPIVTQAPGEYTIRGFIRVGTGTWDCNNGNDTLVHNLVVGYDYDVKPLYMATPSQVRQEDIVSLPQTPSVVIRNIGLNDVVGFRVTCGIFDASNNQVGGGFGIVSNTLRSGSSVTVPMNTQFTPTTAGRFRFRFITQLGADLNRNNDTLDTWRTFYWKYDVKADSILVPLNAISGLPEVPQGGIYRPVGLFENAGASFVATIPIIFEAWKLPISPTDTAEFTSRDTMPELNIADGMRRIAFNTNPNFGQKLWTPLQTGQYLLKMTSMLDNDGDRTNDQVTLEVSSIPRLSGTYMVGFGQEIPTLNAALDSLNYRGVLSPVTFLLMDNNFNYATDLLFSKVRYASPTATVTFKPGPNVNPAINLSGGARIVWDNGASYIGFDGSNSTSGTPNRALVVTQSNPGTPAFFFLRGAKYNTIQNCTIRTPAVSGQTATKGMQTSIGIWAHNAYPPYPNDTLSNSFNTIANNDIQGFRTGIWLQGLAPIFRAGPAAYNYMWDTSNVIRGNLISNCSRAGILLTNQYGAQVYGNEVWNLTNYLSNTCGAKPNEDANVVGIGLGGVRARCDQPFDAAGSRPPLLDSAKGYAVQSIVYNNKVHDLLAQNGFKAIGIEFVQDTIWGNAVGAPSTVQTPGIHPTLTHNVAWNNMIWGLNGGNTNGEAVGILYDARGLGDPTIPTLNGYFTTGDSVMNNTIWVTGTTLARTAALDMSRSQRCMVWNNILVNDATGGQRTILRLAVQSPDRNFDADRNLFWFGAAGASPDTLVRLQILDANGNFRDQKYYPALESWQAGAQVDRHSLFGNPEFKSTTVPVNLHLMTLSDGIWSPARQQGAYLQTGYDRRDIDGEVRGIGGAYYDIGADEFPGLQYANDIFALRVDFPTSSGGTRMVQPPINPQATFQNIGTSNQLQKRLFLTVTRAGYGVIFRDTIVTDMRVGEVKQITFRALPDSQLVNGATYTFTVQTTPDNNTQNDVASTTQTLYIAENAILVSYRSDSPNARADRDSVIRALSTLGFRFDVLDRSAVARPEDISYDAWPTLVYCVENGTGTHPDGSMYTYALSYDERKELMHFLDLGNPGIVRSLVLAGMDVASFHDQMSSDVSVRDTLLTRQYLHLRYVGTPVNGAYQAQLTGVRIEPAMQELINATGGDRIDALMPIRVMNGTSEYAYYYDSHPNLPPGGDTAAGVTFAGQTNVLNYNAITYGFDWRHLSRLGADSGGIKWVLLNSLDYVQKNHGCIVPCVVPVELVSFDARLIHGDVAVTWETASETNVAQFEAQRQGSDGAWRLVDHGSVPARGTPSSGAQYKVLDPSVPPGVYNYRLAYVHNDGHIEYSTTRQVVVPAAYALFQNYPNPFNPTTNITYTLMDAGQVHLTVYDVMGNAVRTLVNETQEAGTHVFPFDASDLASGVYYYRLEVNGFTASRRLMLMK